MGSRRTATRVTPGAICLSSSSHFPLKLYSNCDKAGGVAARPRQAIDEAGADRIGDDQRTRSARCGSPAATAPRSRLPWARMTSGASATNSAAYLRMSSALPAAQRVSIRTLRPIGPAQLLQRLQERCDAGLTFRIVRGCGHEARRCAACARAAARARRAASCRRTAEKRDELAPPHVPPEATP